MRFETVFAKGLSRPIEDWLAQLGLARYADAFVAAEIDLDILSELTDADLAELGVLLGDRKRILKASMQGTAASAPARRQPTVIYCDLVDSTELAVRLDPRELRIAMSAYHARCADVIAAYGGEAQYLGGAVTVAFAGGPGDAEDADRATRCAFALLASIGELAFSGRTRLAASIGIATGSEAGPSPPNLAARLQRLAEAENVLIAEPTRGFLGDAFAFAALGSRATSGHAEPFELWRVEPVASEPFAGAADMLAVASIVMATPVVAGSSEPEATPHPTSERHIEDARDPSAALKHWQSERERAERLHDPALQVAALHASWTLAFSIGDLSYTLAATARGLALHDAAPHTAPRTPGSGHDAGVCAAGYRALALILAGRIVEGRSWMRRAESALARVDDPATRCAGLLALALACDLLGEYDVAIAVASDARKLASKSRLETSLAHAALASAAARIAMGDRLAGVRALEELLDEPGSAVSAGWRAYYLVRLAFAEVAAGHESAADARLAAAEQLASERGGCVAAGEIARATATALQRRGAPYALVAQRLEHAAQLARAQLATLLELRAASDLLESALAFSADATPAVTVRLRHILERIDGGESTFDVRRARALERRALR